MKKIIPQYNNAQPHSGHLCMERIQRNGWELVPHSPYSVDLAPSDYSLLMVIKDQI